MTRQLIVACVLLPWCFPAVWADDSVVVEVQTAVDDAPAGLKTGTLVDLLQVNGKTVTRTGKVSYNLTGLAQKLEVVSVLPVEKSTPSSQKVQLRVTKSQAALIDKAKARTVTVVETTTDGKTTTMKKPIPLRLELSKSERK